MTNFDARMVQLMYSTFDRLRRDDLHIDCHLVARPSPHMSIDIKHAFIKAHKVILAAVSPYFDRCIRKQCNSALALIDLTNFDQSTVEQLVAYIYKGHLLEGADKQALLRLALHCEMLTLYEYCAQQQSPVVASTPPQKMEVTPSQIVNGLANTGGPVLPIATPSALPSAFSNALKRRAPGQDQSEQSPLHFEELMKRFKLDGQNNSDLGDTATQLKALIGGNYGNLTIDTLGNHADSRFVAPHLGQPSSMMNRPSLINDLPTGYPQVPEINFELQRQLEPQTSPAKMHIQNYLINRAVVLAALNHNNTQQALQQAIEQQQQCSARENLFDNLNPRRGSLLDTSVFKRLQELATTNQQHPTVDAQPLQPTKEIKKEVIKEEEDKKKPAEDKDEGWCRNKKYIEKVDNGFMCTVCKKVYGRYNSVSYHVTIYHRNPPIECEIDGCQFTTREARYIHFHKYYRHGIALPKSIDLSSRSCPFCRHIAKSPAMLEKHIKRHVGDTQNLATALQPNLTVVVKDADEDGGHNCDVCNAAFTSKNALYEHTISAHERPITYDCHLCSRRAMPGSIYQQHMQLAHQQSVTLATSIPTPSQGTSGSVTSTTSTAPTASTITLEQVIEASRQIHAARRSNHEHVNGLDEGVNILAAATRKHSGPPPLPPPASDAPQQ